MTPSHCCCFGKGHQGTSFVTNQWNPSTPLLVLPAAPEMPTAAPSCTCLPAFAFTKRRPPGFSLWPCGHCRGFPGPSVISYRAASPLCPPPRFHPTLHLWATSLVPLIAFTSTKLLAASKSESLIETSRFCPRSVKAVVLWNIFYLFLLSLRQKWF